MKHKTQKFERLLLDTLPKTKISRRSNKKKEQKFTMAHQREKKRTTSGTFARISSKFINAISNCNSGLHKACDVVSQDKKERIR